MDFMEIEKKHRTVRKFSQKPVEEEKLICGNDRPKVKRSCKTRAGELRIPEWTRASEFASVLEGMFLLSQK
jgi:hypothetical protein